MAIADSTMSSATETDKNDIEMAVNASTARSSASGECGTSNLMDDDENINTHRRRKVMEIEEKGGTNGETSPLPLRRKMQFAVSTRWEREMEENARLNSISKCGCLPRVTCTSEDFHSLCCCFSRRVGGMFSLLEKRDGTPIIIAGPCWPFCMFITTPLILVLSALASYFIILNPKTGLPWWIALIYYPLLGITLLSLFCVSCRDPGLLERVTDEEAGHGGWFWNEQVGSFRPAGAMYCRECKCLIQDYDHLCPWTGTGIGRGNMVAFKVFVVFVNLLCYITIGLTSYVLLNDVGKSSD